MTTDRESLDASEPRDAEEPVCPLCGTRIAHPFEPGGLVRCHPDRGGCGVYVRGVPYLAQKSEGESTGEAGPARTHWERCCTPYAPGRPSGRFMRHSARCPLYPDERMTKGELLGRISELEARRDHPAGAVPVLAIREDAAYMEAHSDDEDD